MASNPLSTWFGICLFLTTFSCAAFSGHERCVDPNPVCDSLVPHLKAFHPSLHQFEILDKIDIHPKYAAVLFRGVAPDAGAGGPTTESFWKSETFGIFIVDNDGQYHLTLDIYPTKRMLDYQIRYEEHGLNFLVIAGGGATYGDGADKKKYFFDLEERKLISIQDGINVNIKHVAEFKGALYFVGVTNKNTSIITKYSPARAATEAFEVLQTIDNQKIEPILEVRSEGGRLVLTSETYQYFLEDSWKRNKNPTPTQYRYNTGSGKFIGLPTFGFWVPAYQVLQRTMALGSSDKPLTFLLWDNDLSANGHGGERRSGIYEIGGGVVQFHPLPQPGYERFSQYRPARVADGYSKDVSTIETEIGPFQREGSRLWFGLKFYDGEGHSGIGGVGYFDTGTRRYEVTYHKEIAGSSAYSILVEPDTIWLGLGGQPEGAPYSNGLVGISRKNESLKRYDVPGMINAILRHGRLLYLGTSDGVTVLGKVNGIENLRWQIDMDGRYRVTRQLQAIRPPRPND